MGYTLDQLLDETGVGALGGARLEKKAAEKPSFSKLAERCRRAATATAEERSSSDDQLLAEKTASVAIIGRTLAEIREITGEDTSTETVVKTAAVRGGASFSVEVFIKTALDQGHSPEKIAEWLDKNAGLFDKVKGGIREFKAGRSVAKADRLASKAEAVGGKGFRQWEDHVRRAESLGDADRAALVSRMRVNLGDERAAKLVQGSKALRDLPGSRDLKRLSQEAAVTGGKPSALGVSIGGTHAGVTSEQLNKLKKPAALVGAGYLGHRALASGKPEEKKKSGVVVVNS